MVLIYHYKRKGVAILAHSPRVRIWFGLVSFGACILIFLPQFIYEVKKGMIGFNDFSNSLGIMVISNILSITVSTKLFLCVIESILPAFSLRS